MMTTPHNPSFSALFPGQGSQYPGMSKVLLDQFPWVKEHFEEASDVIKTNLIKLCEEGPSEELQLTMNAQPAILVTSFSWFKVLQKNLGFRPAAAAGHSLGEYTALTAADALTLGQAVKLVRRRGELMQQAVPKGKGKMTAVIGLEDAIIGEICKAASQGSASQVVPANFNAPSQVVIAGHSEAVDRFTQLASDPAKPQWKARKLVALNVSAPFHCPLMTPTALTFVEDLEQVPWRDPKFPIVSNLDAKMRTTGSLTDVLRDQIDHPVLWTECVRTLDRHGMKQYIELGPSRVLTGLVKRIVEGATIHTIDSLEDFKKLETVFKGV
ncbi:[acyl-carrier-protein] S-malonyltransferase [bacterium]|nr:[acyl-carrier-protein] S-malonyltransferase [bacterium]